MSLCSPHYGHLWGVDVFGSCCRLKSRKLDTGQGRKGSQKLGDFHFDLLEWFRNSKIWVKIWIKISRRKMFDAKKVVGKEKHTLIFLWKNNDDLVENHGWWAYLSHDQFSYFWTKMVYYNTYQTTNVTEVTFKVWYLILWGSTKVVSLEG